MARCMGKKRTGRDGEMHEEDREWMVRYTKDREVANCVFMTKSGYPQCEGHGITSNLESTSPHYGQLNHPYLLSLFCIFV